MTDNLVETGRSVNEGPLLGYRMLNPDAPASEPRLFEPVNEEFQRNAERIFDLIASAP